MTSDLDFGQMYHFDESSSLGVIVLRLTDQRVEHVNAVLDRFFTTFTDHDSLAASLVVIEDDRYRFYTKNRPRGSAA